MKSALSKGSAIGYELRGSGVPVLLAHGLLGDGSFWDEVAAQLEEDFRLIVCDLRGHRRSQVDAPFSMWDVADDLVAILDAEGIESAPLVGFSMGGMASMRCALRYPSRVKALSLISTAAGGEKLMTKRRNFLMASIVQRTGPLRIFEPMVKDLMFTRDFRRRHPSVVEDTLESSRRHGGRSIAHAVRAVFGRDDIVQRLHAIDVPAQILVGDRDKLTPPGCSKQMARALSKSELSILPGIAHMSPTEAPQRIAEKLHAFLSRVA